MGSQNKVTGAVLAGGLARRMNGHDKGLLLYRKQPLVSFALRALSAVADEVVINANRNLDQYRRFGYALVPDRTGSFDGPLAGVLAAMAEAQYGVLLVMPCDSPLIQPVHLQKILDERALHDADIAVAFDGERLHPVFLALKVSLQDSLASYLQQGQRKIDSWIEKHHWVKVDFSQEPDVFVNINTLMELEQFQTRP